MQNCTLWGDKCKLKNLETNFWKEKCRISTIAGATKSRHFTGKNIPNYRNMGVWTEGLCEIYKMKCESKKYFVQKAGVAVFPVKIAKKC